MLNTLGIVVLFELYLCFNGSFLAELGLTSSNSVILLHVF